MDSHYFAIDPVDDHDPTRKRVVNGVIGVYVLDGALPHLVSCGQDHPPGRSFDEPICINEVARLDHPHRAHLTMTSLITLSAKQRNFLFDCGFLNFERPGCYLELLCADRWR